MSLSQRLQTQLEKKMEGQANDVEQLQNVIRQLKLLSKSQTALLKSYLRDKLTKASDLISRASQYLEAKNDVKAKDLTLSLKALKLEDLDVDVTSTNLALQEELSKLRIATENNGYLPSSSSVSGNTTTTSAESLQKIRDMEQENAKLAQQVAELKSDLSKASQSSSSANSKTSANQEEINKLKATISDLNASLEKTKRENENSQQKINDLTRQVNDTAKEKALQTEIDKLRAQLQEEKQSKVQLQQDLDRQYQLKIQELNGLNEQKLKEKEDEWAAEREDMEAALAEELEEVEKSKDEEIAKLKEEIAELTTKITNLQRFNSGLTTSLKRCYEKMKNVQRDYKTTFANAKREMQTAMGSVRQEYGGMLTAKITALADEITATKKKYLREMSERKRLHNVVQELKGNIRVYLRCRPPTTKELDTFGADSMCVSFPNPGEIKVFNSEKNREKVWEFDEVFGPETRQEDVYNDVSALVTSVLDGYNVCIFAYGQTGSGKTFTMSGPNENPGVNTRALEELFQKIADRSREWNDEICVSILEVYNEDIRDLLNEGSARGGDSGADKLEVKMGEFGNYVPGLTELPVFSMAEVLQLIQKADRVRASATTNMNEHSSRSHMMLTVTIKSEFTPTKLRTRGKLNLVDLAGSERINKSGAQGQALKEAQNINKSLFALGDVIAARAQKNAHIPFRNSTLTFLLQDSLSQDSKTLMIVCISPALYNCEETTCSLNFAAKVKTVELGRATKNITAAGQGAVGGSSTKSNTGSMTSGSRRASVGK